MQPAAYRALAQHERDGWYYQARARAVKTLARRFIPSSDPIEILDVGCGTGGTTHALAELGRVVGLEPDALAVDMLRGNFPSLHVVRGTVDESPRLFGPERFDLATIMGVLYHKNVADPVVALQNLRYTLKPGGWIIWNEASYPFLRRAHDDFVHTGRRFYPREMRTMLEAAGFEVCFGSPLLCWAFPIAMALAFGYRARRLAAKFWPWLPTHDPADDRHLPAAINRLLQGLTYWEWTLSLKFASLPCGVSYLVMARNQGPAEHSASSPRLPKAA